MSLELPPTVVWIWDSIPGLPPWPGLDEDWFRERAGDVRRFAAQLGDSSARSHAAVAALASEHSSPPATALAQHWMLYHGTISALKGPLEAFASALDPVAADAVVAQKGVAIGGAVALAGTLAAGDFTFGLADLGVPAEEAIIRTAVQELESILFGVVVSKACQEIAAHLSGTFAKLVSDGGQVAMEAATVHATYDTAKLTRLMGTLHAHQAQTSHAGATGLQRSTSRELATGGPGGGWREVAKVVEQAVLRILILVFKDLVHAFNQIIDDTNLVIGKMIAQLEYLNKQKVPDGVPAMAADRLETDRGSAGTDNTVPTDATRTRASVTGEQTAGRDPALVPACKDPVDAATGAVLLGQVDVELAGVLPLVLERAHWSSYRAGRWFGPSWASTLDQRLVADHQGVIYTAPDGRLLCYPHPPEDGSEVWPVAGARWPLCRDGENYLISHPSDGRTLKFASHGSGPGLLLTEVRDRNSNTISFVYGVDGAPQRVEHSGGYRINVATEGERVTGLSLAGAGEDGRDAPLMRFEYADGHLVQVVNSSGQPLEFSYDDVGRMTGWKDRNGCWYRYSYDEAGRCVEVTGPDVTLSATFDYQLHHTTVTGADGATTVFDLDEHGLVVAETDAVGGVTRYEHDEYGQLVARTDPLGRATGYRYGDHGLLTELVRADNTRQQIEYTRHGAAWLPSAVTAPDESTWRYASDKRGNLTAVTAPDGTVTSYRYNGRGNLAAVTGPDGAVTRILCDAAGLPVAVTGPDGSVTRVRRDGFGRVVAMTGPAGQVTRYGWTTEGRLAWRQKPDGTREEATYDGEGNLIRHTDPAGQVTAFTYTHFDLPATVTAPDGAMWRYGYDGELRNTAVTNPADLTWRYDYDPAGRLVAETDFNGRVVRYGHDAAGQLASKVNGAGQHIRYRYDRLGNLTQQEAGGAVTTFRYDPLGRLTGAENADTTLEIRRDPLGRVLSETVNDATVAFGYDRAGRRIRRATPSGTVTNWDYDDTGWPVALATAGHQITFGYDAAGRETSRRIGERVKLDQTWDASDRLTSQILARSGVPGGEGHTGPGLSTAPAAPTPSATPVWGSGPPLGQVLQQRQYRWSPTGLLARVDDQLAGSRTFAHDPLGRITGVTGPGWQERYRYDATGNIAAAHWPTPSPGTPWTAALGDRTHHGTLLHQAGAIGYRYDRQGRVTSRSQKQISGKPSTWHYTWDADDRLTSVTTPDGARWRYVYDPLGRRIAKQRLDTLRGNIATQTRFAWDGPVLVEQTTTGGESDAAEVLTWDYQPGTFTPLTQTRRLLPADSAQKWIDTQFHAIITNNVGAPAELITPNGEVAWHQTATLWGVPTANGTTAATPLRFPGQYHDPETGWYYNHHRYYDPTTSRYTTPDPLGLGAGPNPHTYVANPATQTDPLGLMSCRPGDPLALNLGGEGEVSGAVNLNSLVATLRSPERIRASGPVVQGSMDRLPFADQTFGRVVGNRMPFMHGDFAQNVADEAFRVLSPGGTARLGASNVGGEAWTPYLERVGFNDVQTQGRYAIGVRP